MEGRDFFLFNNALNTLYLRLYGVGHMVKDHSDKILQWNSICRNAFYLCPQNSTNFIPANSIVL